MAQYPKVVVAPAARGAFQGLPLTLMPPLTADHWPSHKELTLLDGTATVVLQVTEPAEVFFTLTSAQ